MYIPKWVILYFTDLFPFWQALFSLFICLSVHVFPFHNLCVAYPVLFQLSYRKNVCMSVLSLVGFEGVYQIWVHQGWTPDYQKPHCNEDTATETLSAGNLEFC